jgi:hypothetical protein
LPKINENILYSVVAILVNGTLTTILHSMFGRRRRGTYKSIVYHRRDIISYYINRKYAENKETSNWKLF